jgi:ELWxxDGT repeat protein
MKKIYITLYCFLFASAGISTAQTFTGIDIWPGTGSSTPEYLTSFNGKVYFQAESDATTGIELWVSDGTQGGTSLLKDIWPGPGSSNPFNFTAFNNKLYFSANDSVHGSELWVTDGTSAGTVMVADIWPGTGSGIPGNPYLTPFNGKLYFVGSDSTHGGELWVTDGTSAGTSLVKDINPGITGSNPFSITLDNYTHYDFTFDIFNGKFYFRADDGVHGAELWGSDGTTAGTTMIADIWPGPGSSNPYYMTVYNGQIVFAANDSVHGFEPWVSDGTMAGTSLLKVINNNATGSFAADNSGFVLYNGKLYFTASQDATGYELWVTDATTNGTKMVSDIWPGPGSSHAGYNGMYPYNGLLYFGAADSLHGSQLWTTDGTGAGTTLFKVLSGSIPYDATPEGFINYNNQLIFVANTDPTNQLQLWASGGTPSGTNILSPAIAPNTNPLLYMNNDNYFAVANGSLFMNADFNSIGDELWVYTTPTGITPVPGENTISVYPNPFSNTVTLSGLESGQQYTVQVLDMIGCEHYSTVINNPAQSTSITMPDLSTGVYLMRVSGQGTGQTFKLVKN